MRTAIAAISVIGSFLGTFAFAGPATQPAKWEPKEFPISFWCAPPEKFTTLERYREIKEANFTYVMPPCGATSVEMNKKVLEYCQQLELKAFVTDSRMVKGIGGNAEAKKKLDGMVADYSGSPALAGYFVTDEPGGAETAGLAEVVAYLREKDPQHFAYINLFPNYVPLSALGTATYIDYVRDYAKRVKPFVISYDHYNMTNHGDRPGFFNNLEDMRTVSLETGIPFWQIVLCLQHFDYRDLTLGELRFEAMQTLAYGGKGLMWFTYWSPESDATVTWQHAMINTDGTKDPHYDMIKQVNAEVLAIGGQLLEARSTGAYQLGNIAPGGKKGTEKDPVHATDPADLTVGVFQDGEGRTEVLIANRDYKNPAHFTAFLPKPGVEEFDAAGKKWEKAKAVTRDANVTLDVSLGAGDAVLLRW